MELLSDVFVELHVPDFDLTESFYGKLGFSSVWRRNGPGGYMVMRKGRGIINFYGGTEDVCKQSYFRQFPADTKRGYAVELVLLVDDIEGFYAEVVREFGKVVEPLKLQPWGRRDFRMEDPFGFYLRFGERYDWIDKT